MKTHIVRIGNSQGVRIPKPLIEQAGLSGEVDISVRNGTIAIKAASSPRAGWEAAFKKMASRGDGALLDSDAPGPTNWDEDQWVWR